MSQEIEHQCPRCDEQTFWRTASTLLALGEKVKWDCASCDYGFVRIDHTVDTSTV